MSDIQIIKPNWPAPRRVQAAFTQRTGGLSVPPFESLNLGAHVGDSSAAVAENRRRVRAHLQLPAEPSWLQQVHGNAVADLDAAAGERADASRLDSSAPDASRADAAITRRRDRVCVIQVADCIPVLFAARDGSAVAAAHAGWRGLAGGVLEATVLALRHRAGVGPDGLCAWLGPGIGQRHFEVGDEVRADFLARVDGRAAAAGADADVSADASADACADPASPLHLATAAAFERNSRGRWQCDLYALARLRLFALGVRDVAGGELCTYSDTERFFSFRRDGRCGRMAALVWLG